MTGGQFSSWAGEYLGNDDGSNEMSFSDLGNDEGSNVMSFSGWGNDDEGSDAICLSDEQEL